MGRPIDSHTRRSPGFKPVCWRTHPDSRQSSPTMTVCEQETTIKRNEDVIEMQTERPRRTPTRVAGSLDLKLPGTNTETQIGRYRRRVDACSIGPDITIHAERIKRRISRALPAGPRPIESLPTISACAPRWQFATAAVGALRRKSNLLNNFSGPTHIANKSGSGACERFAECARQGRGQRQRYDMRDTFQFWSVLRAVGTTVGCGRDIARHMDIELQYTLHAAR
ncbi:hypothetical protein BD311DRAFT_7274 [Dichomitus squalens]|uniref:Uncharacterized protein n=1 Tax=Dichomitus squalens TaxID=114155 RepID=A0A4Q9N8I5_9APHY|nr:hypothetical protein BD311DRAFT_7274 [Dichomitus squalens]